MQVAASIAEVGTDCYGKVTAANQHLSTEKGSKQHNFIAFNTQKLRQHFTLATSMSLAFGNDVVQNGYPAVLWTAAAGPAGIFYRGEFGISRPKQFCVLPNERMNLWRLLDCKKQKTTIKVVKFSGGEKEIRTLEGLLTLAGFQDRCIKPLCHLSAMDGIIKTLAKLVKRFFTLLVCLLIFSAKSDCNCLR